MGVIEAGKERVAVFAGLQPASSNTAVIIIMPLM
jgi:hypothetical protein